MNPISSRFDQTTRPPSTGCPPPRDANVRRFRTSLPDSGMDGADPRTFGGIGFTSMARPRPANGP